MTRIIAEIGTTHGGDLELAKEMALSAVQAGSNTVKFQTVDPAYFKDDANAFEWYFNSAFSKEQWLDLMAFVKDCGAHFLSTPQTIRDYELLREIGCTEIKISSDNLTNLPLLRAIAYEQVDVFVSTGLAIMDDIHLAKENLDLNRTTWMVCTSLYPCPPEQANLRRIRNLQMRFDKVGFSDHTESHEAAMIASAYGAIAFEKHFTLPVRAKGPDARFSIGPESFKQWVAAIRLGATMAGNALFEPNEEILNRRKMEIDRHAH